MGRKLIFTIVFFGCARKWGLNYDLSIFQVLHNGAFLGPEINSLGWYKGCFDILFVSERTGWSGGKTWKIDKIFQNYRILKIYDTQLWQPIPVG